MTITRFAPSPTGNLHLGNIRTALFCWLHAKQSKGTFIIRLDDTNKNEDSHIFSKNIIEDLTWLKLKSNTKPIFQSERTHKYKKAIMFLLKTNQAYKCFCSKDRLAKLKQKQIYSNKQLKYDKLCQNLTSFPQSESFIIRYKTPINGYTSFQDEIKGTIKTLNIELDDFIISKENYLPTYNFATVVDDIDLNITDIIRGEDHISNTLKHINIIKSFGAKLPKFAHIPMVLDENKKPLSKRNNSNSLQHYRSEGFLPEAILNYVLRLGWSYKNKELFTLKEMINLFKIKNANKSASIFDYNKFLWFNKYFIKNTCTNILIKYISPIEKTYNLNYKLGPSLEKLIIFQKKRVATLKDIIKKSLHFYTENIYIKNSLLNTYFTTITINIINKLYNIFKHDTYSWDATTITQTIKIFTKQYNLKLCDIAIPLRITLTGEINPTPIFEILQLSGRTLTLKKFKNIIEYYRIKNK